MYKNKVNSPDQSVERLCHVFVVARKCDCYKRLFLCVYYISMRVNLAFGSLTFVVSVLVVSILSFITSGLVDTLK